MIRTQQNDMDSVSIQNDFLAAHGCHGLFPLSGLLPAPGASESNAA